MASTLKPTLEPLNRYRRARFLSFWSHQQPWWHSSSSSSSNKDGARPLRRLPGLAGHNSRLPLHPLSLRFQVLRPSSPLRPLHQFRPHRSMTNPPQAAAGTSPASSPTKTVRVVIKGRVQGVFYRNWTIENASQLGLNGWVRNRRDGSVEALFSGKPEIVNEMEQRCRHGPPDAMVTALEVFPCSDDPGTGFQRKPTI